LKRLLRHRPPPHASSMGSEKTNIKKQKRGAHV
jgi:hypothetical protein